MISIRQANADDHLLIAQIGKITVEEAHRESCAPEDLQNYMETHYTNDAILQELNDARNMYHLIFAGEEAAGFSKIILNTSHENIAHAHVTKLDRIYLLNKYFDQGMGYCLLQHNIRLAKAYQQSGMWLFTWTGNQRAVGFYQKAGFCIIGSHLFKVSETHYNENHHMFLDFLNA